MKKILWDREEDEEAINWDGTTPTVLEDVVIIKDLGCNCPPGEMCGGCVDVYKEYPIGLKERYFWKQT